MERPENAVNSIENYYDLNTFCHLNYNLENSEFAKFDKTIYCSKLYCHYYYNFKDMYYVNENCIVEKVN